MYYINCFFLYSFLGFIIENIVHLINKDDSGSGILYGPWTPIYGVGSVLILVIAKLVFRILTLKKWLEVLIMAIIMMIILTLIEWIGGVLIEKFFHITFWDYRKLKFHIGKYISLEISFIWAIGSVLVIYVIQPLFDKFIYLIPNYITYLLIIVMIIDYIVIIFKRKTHK